jgi:membrane protein YqaA with SNARE-associated domain
MEGLPLWLRALISSFGGLGLFVIAFLDSSIFSFPIVNDLLLMRFTVQSPALMPYYVLMSTLGSLVGCIWLYYLAERGGEVMYRHGAGRRAERIRVWVNRYKFLSVAVPSVLPPPFPFKPFVLAAGVFQVPMKTFVLALLVGRAVRYFAEGFLAMRYGERASHYLVQNKLDFLLVTAGTIAISYLAWRWLFGEAGGKQ